MPISVDTQTYNHAVPCRSKNACGCGQATLIRQSQGKHSSKQAIGGLLCLSHSNLTLSLDRVSPTARPRCSLLTPTLRRRAARPVFRAKPPRPGSAHPDPPAAWTPGAYQIGSFRHEAGVAVCCTEQTAHPGPACTTRAAPSGPRLKVAPLSPQRRRLRGAAKLSCG